MEPVHRARLSRRFRANLDGKRVACLRIPDRYAYMDPDLVELLRRRMAPHLPPG